MGEFIVNNIKIPVSEAYKSDLAQIVLNKVKASSGNDDVYFRFFLRTSIDARHKSNVSHVISAVFEADDCFIEKNNLKKYEKIEYENLIPGTKKIKRPVIIGAGPCGLFAAHLLSVYGYEPIVIEQGKQVEKRDSDIKSFFDTGTLNTESNIQFGEGGAGTYSDGKLFTRINDPHCQYILSMFCKMGADESILYRSDPHIGSDSLKHVVKNFRNEIIDKGGKFLFESKVTDIVLSKDRRITSVVLQDNTIIECDTVVFATGHSARDTYEMLFKRGVPLKQKPFSAGFRIEHRQSDINENRYGKSAKYMDEAADYQLSFRGKTRGVYTFCMCPGGYVINASSEKGHLVTNGMSMKKRDGMNANSAWVVSVPVSDFSSDHPLSGIEFQRMIEKKAYEKGFANYVAGVQSVQGFLNKEIKKSGRVTPTIKPGCMYSELSDIFSSGMYNALCESAVHFEKILPCFLTGVLTGAETRTSAPVSIQRDENRMAQGIYGLFPCGEGAGMAGGIMSAAADGLKTAEYIIQNFKI